MIFFLFFFNCLNTFTASIGKLKAWFIWLPFVRRWCTYGTVMCCSWTLSQCCCFGKAFVWKTELSVCLVALYALNTEFYFKSVDMTHHGKLAYLLFRYLIRHICSIYSPELSIISRFLLLRIVERAFILKNETCRKVLGNISQVFPTVFSPVFASVVLKLTKSPTRKIRKIKTI